MIFGGVDLRSLERAACLEDASKRTNVPLTSAHTWTPFHHPHDICSKIMLLLIKLNINKKVKMLIDCRGNKRLKMWFNS